MSNSSSRMSDRPEARKRNLPSWMSDRPEAETTAAASIADPNKQFSKLMKGVVFALSGFVNPERGTLRSQAIEMGAEYQPDWNPNCTLLVCAFQSTPKFRQVEADSGTIVSKEWISECYNQKKLVDIEPYLMNPGKPWRKQTGSAQANPDSPSPSGQAQTQVEKSSHSKPVKAQVEKSSHSKPGKADVETSSHPKTSSKGVAANHTSDTFSPSRVKQWASDDFRRTVTWLEDQDEKPEKSEMKKIAMEGIVTCLQDTIDALKEGQNIKQITEEWGCIPKAVEELIKLNETRGGDTVSVHKQATEFKRIYEAEYIKMEDNDSSATKKPKTTATGTQRGKEDKKKMVTGDKTADDSDETNDSDETIEMTEDEIDQAFNVVSSKLVDSSR